MPAQAAAPITGPWAFVGGFVSSLFGGRGKSYREALRERGPIPLPDVFRPEPVTTRELPTIVVTAPRPSVPQTPAAAVRRFVKWKRKTKRTIEQWLNANPEARDAMLGVAAYYSGARAPITSRSRVVLPRNDARPGKSKQRGFVSPAPTKIVPGSIGYSSTPFKMRKYPNPDPAPQPQPQRPTRTARVTALPMPMFFPSELPQPQPQPQPQRQPVRRADPKPGTKTAPAGWEGEEVFLPMPQRTPQPAPRPKPATKTKPRAPAPPKSPAKLPAGLPFALQALIPRGAAPKASRPAAVLRRVPDLAKVPDLMTAPLLQRAAVGLKTVARTGSRSPRGECECPKPKRKPRQPRAVCYEGRFRESSFGTSKSKKVEIPCQ